MKTTVPSDVTREIKSLVLKQESWCIEKQKLSLGHAPAMMLLLRVKEENWKMSDTWEPTQRQVL